MDVDAPLEDEANDYVSDSNSVSSESDYELQSNKESDLDLDSVPKNGNIDFIVLDIKSHPPSWMEHVQSIMVPPFKFTGGPRLPPDFNVNTTHPIDYFKLFFSDSLIEYIVKCTNDYARIEINKKRRTNLITLIHSGLLMVVTI